MKTLLSLALALGLPLTVCAQNNPIFFGGPADGHGTGQNTPATAANQGGGSGGGASGGESGALLAANQTGGTGDGAGAGVKDALPAVTNTGGGGDGSAALGKDAPPAITNGGGNGDGHAAQATVPLLAVNQRGGVGDGWSNDTFIGPFVPGVPLPQQFLSFTAKKQDDDALLHWRMENEKGVDRYTIERSSNAVTFSRIGEVVWEEAARGAYYFTDARPLRGHNYYRIRVMTGDGEKLTPVRLVVFDEAPAGLVMKLYPNPATTRITVALPAAWLGANTVLNIYNAGGTLVLQQKLVPLSHTEAALPVDALAPGVYTLQAATDAESLRAPFVKR